MNISKEPAIIMTIILDGFFFFITSLGLMIERKMSIINKPCKDILFYTKAK